MSLRAKMLIVFIFMTTLPVFIFWGGGKQLYEENLQDYRNFTEQTFVDWRDGEIEHVAYNTSIYLRNRVREMEKVLAYQTNLAGSMISNKDNINKVWPALDDAGKLSSVTPLSHHFILKSGNYYKYNGKKQDYFIAKPMSKSWYKAAMGSNKPVFETAADWGENAQTAIVVAEKLVDQKGRVLGVSAIYFDLPEVFPKDIKKSMEMYDKRNTQMEGFLLNVQSSGDVTIIASQKRDYISPLIHWNMPLLENVFADEKMLVERIRTEVAEDKNILQKEVMFEGKRYLWSFGPVNGSKIVFALFTPLEGIMNQVHIVSEMGEDILTQHDLKFSFVMLCAFVLAVVSSIFCSAALTRRIRKIIESLDAVDEGKPFVFDHENARDEISDLSHRVEYVLRSKENEIISKSNIRNLSESA